MNDRRKSKNRKLKGNNNEKNEINKINMEIKKERQMEFNKKSKIIMKQRERQAKVQRTEKASNGQKERMARMTIKQKKIKTTTKQKVSE